MTLTSLQTKEQIDKATEALLNIKYSVFNGMDLIATLNQNTFLCIISNPSNCFTLTSFHIDLVETMLEGTCITLLPTTSLNMSRYVSQEGDCCLDLTTKDMASAILNQRYYKDKQSLEKQINRMDAIAAYVFNGYGSTSRYNKILDRLNT